MILNFWNFF